MQLKSLEIHGFKSFAEKTRFLFDEGVTGIVGPNGCGKSNIVDAIRWVLGEQRTRNLRSEKMENIIFNGTSKRKKSNFCQVSLTFENTKNILPTEYTTVAITRKLYRTGESEYQLNGVPCRLKDIQNLFMDTGVGPDSYAIIELKMVEEILNDKDNSRRGLFEEAAGISKYKLRKKQTLKKLKETEHDLERVEDVLFEIDKQLKSLERQAKKAERYFRLKADYKTASSRHAYLAIRDLRLQYEKIEHKENEYEDRIGEIQSRIAKLEARHMELQKEQVDQEQLLRSAQEDLNQHNDHIREIEKEKSIRNERLKYLQQREFAIKDQSTKGKEQAIRLEEELGLLEKRLSEVDQDFSGQEAALEKLKAATEELKDWYEEERQQVKNQELDFRDHDEALRRMSKEKEMLEIRIESLENELERHQEDSSSKTVELDSFSVKREELEHELEELNKMVDWLKAAKEKNENAITDNETRITELKDTIYKTSRGLDARQNEYNLTKSLVENLEGFPESVKFLKKEASWIREAPLLSDVFNTPEAYKVAFENLLEPLLSYYVVESVGDAMQAVKLLFNASKGRANFFVLDELEAYKKSEALKLEWAKPALSLVEFSPKHQQLAEYLLDSVYVVDEEWQVPDELPAGITIITRQGNLLRRHYQMGGGSIGLFQGKRLGRAKNLEKLKNEIRKYEKELNQLKTELDKAEQKMELLKQQNYSRELDKSTGLQSRKAADLSVLKAREEEHRNFLERSGQRSDSIEAQLQELEGKVDTLVPQITQLRQQVSDEENMLEESRRMLENRRLELSEQQQEFNQQNISFIQQKNLRDNLNKDLGQKQDRLERLKREDGKLKAELEKTQKDIHELVSTNHNDDEEIVALYETKKEKAARTEHFEQIVARVRNSLQQVEQEVRKERRFKEETEKLKDEIREQVTGIKLKLNSLKERMEVEFEVDIADLDEEELFPKGLDKAASDEIEAEMIKLREKLQKYGEINPMAVEAYNEMKERADFIREQRQDLDDAKQTLLATIQEIDETATVKFNETFVEIRKNFKRVFRSLFQEKDDCDLLLTNPDDPLESPIEIMAKPKGKRPLTLKQLSGGEKTLTAISLLFAIYLIKPAPFCIFDEVDAPLDDANIDKFNNIIRDFSKDSQFILVTHNKRTMAATHVMYGVTMPAANYGVSQAVPVNLETIYGPEELSGEAVLSN